MRRKMGDLVQILWSVRASNAPQTDSLGGAMKHIGTVLENLSLFSRARGG